jgi:Cu-Zn family superoxide dismutase
VGRCDPPDFTSAGGHFNPQVRQHGRQNPLGPHAGDLPNLVVGADGAVNAAVIAPDVTLGSPVNSHSLFPPAGTALVIHAKPDDGTTDPAGNAGPRIACGVITR